MPFTGEADCDIISKPKRGEKLQPYQKVICMKNRTPDPYRIIRTTVIYLMLCAFLRGYISYRQCRLTALYGEFDTYGINTAADMSGFIDSYF